MLQHDQALRSQFAERRHDILQSRGISTAQQLLSACVGLSTRQAELFMAADSASEIDSVTMCMVARAINASARYLILGLSPQPAKEVSPDEDWLVDSFRCLVETDQERLTDALKRMLFRRRRNKMP